MKKVGRPKKYEFESKDEIIEFIKDYKKSYNPYPLIKYKHIWEHSLALYEQNLFPIKTSYDFWKRDGRLGKELVDLINALEEKKVYISETERIDIINIKELLEKYGGKYKEILWKNLEPYDNHINRFVNRITKLQEENNSLKEHISEEQSSIQKLKEDNNKLQQLVYSLFTYSNKDNELVNMINTGQSKSNLINFALEKTFSEPHLFFKELIKYTPNQIEGTKMEKQDNLIYLRNNKSFDKDEPEYEL